jgi:hypothetical protein
MDTKGNLHKSNRLFDGKNFEEKLWKYVKEHVKSLASFRFLDYGCGKALHCFHPLIEGKTLHQALGSKCQSIYLYDPAYPPYSEKPSYESPFHIVSCSDVMEHVPEEAVLEVLTEIFDLSADDSVVFFSIAGKEAYKSFADGENLHCTIKPLKWWIDMFNDVGFERYVIVYTDDKGEHTAFKGFNNAAV